MATPILNLPPTAKMLAANFTGPKKANLGEALLYFTGRELVDAHSARADTIGCRDVFFAIRDGGKKFEPAQVSAAA
jgi:DNA polymerase-3 subunit epsilon